MLHLYNTLSRTKEPFTPIDPEHIRIYVCGMTVYDYCHIGHARVMVAFDIMVRHLRHRYPSVTYVRNITDIDDKIINRAAEHNEDIYSLTERFIAHMHEDEEVLGVLSPDKEPKATDHIGDMQNIVATLMDKGLAYQGENGDIYYRVSEFADYGKLSGKALDDLVAGTRVEVATDKENPLDFVLWKSAKTGEVSWDSPWGEGRPGWHIECSAMSKHHLGESFDIHGGGADLSFPHHDNEIAQSEGAHDCTLATYWTHVGFVNIDGEKMSKSLNNFFTIRDVLKHFDGEVIRYFIISSHYRSPLNYSEKNLNIAKQNLTKLYTALRDITPIPTDDSSQYAKEFYSALDDDVNTPIALSVLYSLAKDINTASSNDKPHLAGILVRLGNHLGILQNAHFLTTTSVDEALIEQMIAKRNIAKVEKNYARADELRSELLTMGIILEDTKDGTTWRQA